MRFNGEGLAVAVALTLVGCAGNPGGQGAPAPADAGVETVEVAAADRMETADAQPMANSFQLIDDMDHTDPGLPSLPADSAAFFWRSPTSTGLGNWFLSSLGERIHDALPDSIVPPRGDSKKASHVSGGNFERGADLWAQLDHPAGHAVDLRAYAGIAFWARLTSSSGKLVVAINDRAGVDYFAAEASASPLPTRTLAVSDQWQQFVLPFGDFGLDAPAVVSIDFVVGGGGETFDLWIDDLALSCRGACP